MLDINLIRTNPDLVRENIKKKFQDAKLPLVDEVHRAGPRSTARQFRPAAIICRAQRNTLSKQIGGLMAKGQKDEAADQVKAQVDAMAGRAGSSWKTRMRKTHAAEIRKRMLVIPQHHRFHPFPSASDDSENVEIERFGEPVVPDCEVPYHVDIMERLNGIDLDSARRKTSGNGFYYLTGDIARLHSAILSYARDFMIDQRFYLCISRRL